VIDYIHTHQSGFWIALGFLMLVAEALVFGFSTIIFLFAGLGAVITGLLMMAGVIATTWIAGMACFGISTGIVALLLWTPMRKLQNGPVKAPTPVSDFIGYEFVLLQDISTTQTGKHRYSGVDWKVEIDPSAGVNEMSTGQRVKVASLDAGVLRVVKV